MNNVKEYIEACLFTMPSIYDSRFKVLEHLFAVLGNGVELEDGLITHSQSGCVHPSTVDDHYTFAYERSYALSAGGGNGFLENPEAFFHSSATADAERAVDYKNNYSRDPEYITLYPWSDDERFQPFRRYVGAKNPDFAEQVEYFCKIVEQASLEDVVKHADQRGKNSFMRSIFLEEVGMYQQNLMDWQKNIHMVRQVLL